MWRNQFSQLLNVYGVNVVSQTEIHTAEPLVPELSALVELAIEKLKSHKSPGVDKIPVEQFAMRSINLLFLFGLRRNYLRSGRSRLLYLIIRRVIKQIVVIVQE